jgi:hypothetical protein
MLDEASTICLLSIIIHILNIAVAAHQISAAFILDDIPTAREKRLSKKRKHLLTPYKRNVSLRYSPPSTILTPKNHQQEILADTEWHYMKKHTHLHEWQFFLLVSIVKDLILRPRLHDDGTRPERNKRPVKHDYFHRFFLSLLAQ